MADDNPEEPPATSTNTSDAMTNPDGGTDPVLELDEVFEALDHPRRRYLLYTLVNGGNEETLSRLAAKIASWEQGIDASEVTDEKQQKVHVSLYHCHIPRLAALEIVDYQEEKDIIVRAVNTTQVQAVLDGAGAELDSRQEAHARDTDAEESE
jgi:hypothetical protein